MGAVESCCKPGRFSAGSGTPQAGKAFTVPGCGPCDTDCSNPCGTSSVRDHPPGTEPTEYPTHIDPTEHFESRFSAPKTWNASYGSRRPKPKALPTPVKSSVSFKGIIQDEAVHPRRMNSHRSAPHAPLLYDEYQEREHTLMWEQGKQAFKAMIPKLQHDEFQKQAKEDSTQSLRMHRLAEDSAKYYLEASKSYVSKMGGGPTIVKATSAKPISSQRSGNIVASINPDSRFDPDEFDNELGEALEKTLRHDMPGKGVMLRPEPTSSLAWQDFLGQTSYPLSVIDGHLERNACRLFENGKPMVTGVVWIVKPGRKGKLAEDFTKHHYQCRFAGAFFVQAHEDRGLSQLCHFKDLQGLEQVNLGAQGIGLQLYFPNNLIRMTFGDSEITDMFVEYLEKHMDGELIADMEDIKRRPS